MNSQPVAPKRGRPRAVDNDTLATFTRISEVSGRSGTGFTTSENYQDPLFEAYQVTCRSKGEPVPDASPYNARNALAAVKATHSHTRKNTDQRNARRAEALGDWHNPISLVTTVSAIMTSSTNGLDEGDIPPALMCNRRRSIWMNADYIRKEIQDQREETVRKIAAEEEKTKQRAITEELVTDAKYGKKMSQKRTACINKSNGCTEVAGINDTNWWCCQYCFKSSCLTCGEAVMDTHVKTCSVRLQEEKRRLQEEKRESKKGSKKKASAGSSSSSSALGAQRL